MADKNAGQVMRFENGGTILLGADTLLNTMGGSLEYTIQGYEPIPYKDRGVLQDPIVGDERPVLGKLSLKYTSIVETDGILAVLLGTLATNKVKNVTAAGKLFTFAMTVRIPDGKDVATGDQAVFAKCYIDGFNVKTKEGAEHDTIEFSFTDNELSPTITRY